MVSVYSYLSLELITGNKFAKIERVVYSKIDFVRGIKRPNGPYVLVTHNGDEGINANHLQILEDPNLIRWFGQNVEIEHPKLESIPIGLANEQWGHGNEHIFKSVMESDIKKTNTLYCNNTIWSHVGERIKCNEVMSKFGIKNGERVSFDTYLENIKKSYFTVAPDGNGVDTHKLWECLYLGTVPIVTKSINSNFYSDLPILFIDSWEDFNVNELTVGLYNDIMKKAKPERLDFNYYKEKILKCID
jgi:hypothetical protein